jgi:hypothetical protein
MFRISNKVLHLLQSYLFNRQQFVNYNGFSSFLYHSTSGIPQGSNLGPLLFICFINDLPSALTCGSLLYADDNKMYSTINNLADALTLQENLNKLSSWCILNKLALNVSKCKVVSYSYKKSPLLFNYHIDNLILKRENTFKGLDIYFDERLNFNYHIDIAVNKALSMLGFIIRNSRDFTNIEIFQLLFKTYVIPCLEYACLVWNPFYQCHVTSIEAVQRKFLIYLHFKVFGVFPLVGTHNHILREQFNFLSLANRRKIIILLFLHKLIHYRIDCADLLQRLCFCIPRVNNRNVLPILTDIHIKHNRPDIIILNKQQKQAYLLDIAVPNSHNITQTYNTKINKYLELSVAMRNLWCLEKISILPLVISATGIVPQSLFKNLKILDLDNTLVVEIQKGILLYSCHIVRKFLNIDTEHNTQQSHNAEARRR